LGKEQDSKTSLKIHSTFFGPSPFGPYKNGVSQGWPIGLQAGL